jgi:hypothetical protein
MQRVIVLWIVVVEAIAMITELSNRWAMGECDGKLWQSQNKFSDVARRESASDEIGLQTMESRFRRSH